ncbi:Cytochrome P450 3A24, partial [Stegodyphus mimosarum]
MWLAIFTGVVIVIVLVLRYLGRNDDYWEKRGVPFAPRTSIINVLTALYSKPTHELVMLGCRHYGRVFGTFSFWTPQLVVSDPELLRDILVKDFNAFPFRRDLSIGNQTMDYQVSFLKGEDWKRVRTIMTPAFTSKKMRNISYIINDCTKSTMKSLEKYAINKESFDCKRIFGTLTMDVIANAAFATKIDSHSDADNIFVKNARKVMEEFTSMTVLFIMMTPRWLVETLRIKSMKSTEFFRSVTLEVIKERKKTGQRYNDILQLMMDAADEEVQESGKSTTTGSKSVETNEDDADQFGSLTTTGIAAPLKYIKLSQEELIAQCVMFFFAAHETTASTLGYMAYSLALNPECQEKLIREVDDAFDKHSQIDHDVVRDMKYLDCVVSETLRMYPVATATEREAVTDYKLGNTGIIIEKGNRVTVPIYSMHYDPEFFPEPEKFDPERWVKDSGKLNHPQYAYLPFGAGPRNCLGMRFALLEIKLGMANILRHYRFKKSERTKVPLQYKVGTGLLIVRELPLMVEKREEINNP